MHLLFEEPLISHGFQHIAPLIVHTLQSVHPFQIGSLVEYVRAFELLQAQILIGILIG